MREGIGSIFLYNIIIVFVLLVFAFLAATMSYNKAFKINSRVVAIIEKYEGYNGLAAAEISNDMISIGYKTSGLGNSKCPEKNSDKGKKLSLLPPGNGYNANTFAYCIYYYDTKATGNNHYRYGVTTYISFDFPFVDVVFDLPIYTKTDSMYNFTFK